MPGFIKACGLSCDSLRKPQRKEELESQVRTGFSHVVVSPHLALGCLELEQDGKQGRELPLGFESEKLNSASWLLS